MLLLPLLCCGPSADSGKFRICFCPDTDKYSIIAFNFSSIERIFPDKVVTMYIFM